MAVCKIDGGVDPKKVSGLWLLMPWPDVQEYFLKLIGRMRDFVDVDTLPANGTSESQQSRESDIIRCATFACIHHGQHAATHQLQDAPVSGYEG